MLRASGLLDSRICNPLRSWIAAVARAVPSAFEFPVAAPLALLIKVPTPQADSQVLS